MGLRIIRIHSYDFAPRGHAAGNSAEPAGGSVSEKEAKSEAQLRAWQQRDQVQQKQIGFIAQELEKVLPELVAKDAEGYLSINYIGLIPVLVEALKEQQTQIEALRTALSGQKGTGSGTPDITSGSSAQDLLAQDQSAGSLGQNIPNPFSQTTTVQYFLPLETKNALLYIFDMQGGLKKTMPLSGRGEGSVTIYGSELSAGMYIYSLYADGKEVDTKRMILTK